MALHSALASPTKGLLGTNWLDHACKVLLIESLLTTATMVFSSLIASSMFSLIQLDGDRDQDTSLLGLMDCSLQTHLMFNFFFFFNDV